MAAKTIDYKVAGPCSINFAKALIGKTKTPVVFQIRTNWLPITSEENGDEPIDFIAGGKGCTIETQLMNVVAIKALKVAGILNTGAEFVVGWLGQDHKEDLVITEVTGEVWKCKAVFNLANNMAITVKQETIVTAVWQGVPERTSDGKLQLFSQIPKYLT